MALTTLWEPKAFLKWYQEKSGRYGGAVSLTLTRLHWPSVEQGIDAALEEQILNIPERQQEPHMHHHHKADPLGGRVKIA
jgi:hypothetical protein